jgi:hypothetical protein
MTATESLSAREKNLLTLAHGVYRRADEALEKCEDDNPYRDSFVAASNAARRQMLDLMFVFSVGDLADVFDRDELAAMMG